VPYGEEDALRFKEELETARRKLEDVSKKAGIAELEWEDQRKQLLDHGWYSSKSNLGSNPALDANLSSSCSLQPATPSSNS
jgi:hypothetical protein